MKDLVLLAASVYLKQDVLTWISHAREKISPLVGISEFDQTISGEKL